MNQVYILLRKRSEDYYFGRQMMGMKNSTFCYEMNGDIRHFGHRIGEVRWLNTVLEVLRVYVLCQIMGRERLQLTS